MGIDLALAGIDVVAREMALFAAVGFLIGGVDDLAIDLIYLTRPRVRDRPDDPPPALRYAVFVPAWDESAVIAPMLSATLARFGDRDVRIYVCEWTIITQRQLGRDLVGDGGLWWDESREKPGFSVAGRLVYGFLARSRLDFPLSQDRMGCRALGRVGGSHFSGIYAVWVGCGRKWPGSEVAGALQGPAVRT